jgi:cytidyltransferase-like protein
MNELISKFAVSTSLRKRILVDMSLTTVHHGHVRLLRKAHQLGDVIVALTSDEEIFKSKGFYPMLSFEHRKEIALAFKYVNEVIKCQWLIDEKFLDLHNIDFLVHGEDNQNPVPSEKLVIFKKTTGISSSQLRNSNRG